MTYKYNTFELDVKQKWIPGLHSKGRSGGSVDFFVLHTYAGVGCDLYKWYTSGRAGGAAHYAICLSGKIYQYIRDTDTAWANTNKWANKMSLTTEHADGGKPNDKARSDRLYDASARLHAHFSLKYKNSELLSRGNTKLHREFDARKSCPGALDYNRIIAEANYYIKQEKNYMKKLAEEIKLRSAAELALQRLKDDTQLIKEENTKLKASHADLEAKLAQQREEMIQLSKLVKELKEDHNVLPPQNKAAALILTIYQQINK